MTPSSNSPVVLITGASNGIGLELARVFAAERYDLVLVARRKDALDRLGADLAAAHGIRSTTIAADLSRPDAVEVIERAVSQAGLTVDVLVNNAGYGTYGPFDKVPIAEEVAELQVNVIALTALTKRFLPAMLARGSGRILNVASTAGFQPGPYMAVYYASKAYVLSFSEALAEELRGTGVEVTTLCPGPTPTGFQERARLTGDRPLVAHNPFMLDAATVARAGYDKMKRGGGMVIPGLMNKVVVQSLRISPRRMATRIARWLNSRR